MEASTVSPLFQHRSATCRTKAPLRLRCLFPLLAGLLYACGGSSPGPANEVLAGSSLPIREQVQAAAGQPVYRFAKLSNGAYFFTGDENEKNIILQSYPDFRYEGVGFYQSDPVAGVPVYRFANLGNGGYFYTANAAERDEVIRSRPDMRFEGSSYSVAVPSGAGVTPVYRLANLRNGAYLFTTFAGERDAAVALGYWRYEGVAFYTLNTGPVDPLLPPPPVLLAEAVASYAVEAAGVGGDGDGGDGGVGGAAGDGAPIANTVVTLTDVAGNTVEGLTDANGKFLLKFKTSVFRPPYVLRVVDPGGNVRSSVLLDPVAAGRAVWANVNPMTDKIVSDALASSVGGTDKRFNGSRVDAALVAKAKADMVQSVKAALGTAGIADTTNFDPVRSVYKYDGTGVDAVIDSLNHTRDAATGATQLRTKLEPVATNAAGTEVPKLVTASSPLATSQVILADSGALTFEKVRSWALEINRCLALSAQAYQADAACVDADGSRLVMADYRSGSKDFREDFRTLFSETDGSHVQGSTLRNASLLYLARPVGSSVADLAAVEFTIRQPRIGEKGPDGAAQVPVEYTKIAIFKRNDSLIRAKAGNWLLYGNRLNYDLAIEPRYYRFNQANPAAQVTFPSYLHSSLRMFVSPKRYNAATRSYVDANLKAVRVKGPGLPAGGVVLAPSTACGASDYLALLNKTGQVPATVTMASIVQNDFRLASILATGQAFATPGNYFPTRDITVNSIPYVTDFSPIRAYSAYSFEIFLKSNPGGSVADAVEVVRIYAPLVSPTQALNLPMNDVLPSLGLVSFGAPAIQAGTPAVAAWSNNNNAAPVFRSSLYGEEYAGPSLPTKYYIVGRNVAAAYSLGVKPTTQAMVVPTSTSDPNCSAGRFPAFDGNTGLYRELTLTGLQGRSRVMNSLGWNR